MTRTVVFKCNVSDCGKIDPTLQPSWYRVESMREPVSSEFDKQHLINPSRPVCHVCDECAAKMGLDKLGGPDE